VEVYPPGVTWAEANAIRPHLRAGIGGDMRGAVEFREATEGRGTAED